MKTKALIEAGSGCFVLPLLSLAASASDLPIVSSPQVSSEPLSYPAVGFDGGQLEPTLAEEADLTIEAISLAPATELPPLEAIIFQSETLAESPPTEAESPALGTMLVHLSIEGDNAANDTAEDGFIREEFEPVEVQSDDAGIREVGSPALVKGSEDGYQARSLKNWLIPFDDVVKTLGFTTTLQADGQLELRSPEIVTQVRLDELAVDPELGSVWSVAEIENRLGASVEFDRSQYAIRFNRLATSQSVSAQPTLDQNTLAGTTFSDIYSVEIATNTADSSVSEQVETSLSLDSLVLDNTEPSNSELINSELVNSELVNSELGIMLVGLAVDSITTVESTLVKGKEDGASAIAFDQWLIPFDDAMVALGGDVTPQADGTLAIRIPGVATSLDPATLQTDPDLGITLSIADIEENFGIPS